MSGFTILGLRIVREAARRGSFSLAAERLGYTQSAVSRQVALMERAAGRPLFIRQARGVQLTDAGRILVRRADAVLEQLRSTTQELDDLAAHAPGRVRVGAFSTAMAALLPRALAAFAEAEPQTRVPLREGMSPSLLTAVERGRLDLAVVNAPARVPDEVDLTPLLNDPLFVAMAPAHPLAGRSSVTSTMLRTERWIAGSAETDTPLLGVWTDSSWDPEIAFVARDWVAKFGLVAAGLGLTVVPGLAVPALPSGVSVVRLDHPAATRTTAVACRSGTLDGHRLRRFVDTLQEIAAELALEALRHR